MDTSLYYRTVADADAYFADQLYADDWTLATEADKEKAILAASRAVNSLKFAGFKKPVYDLLAADPDATAAEIASAAATQTNEFPRDDQATQTVQTVLAFATTPSGGTFTLTITIKDLGAFTTLGIAYNANAATIEAAIDAAATLAAISGWTDGDISVSGGDLTTANVTLTFDGASVDGVAHKTAPVLDGAGLTGGSVASPSGSASIVGELPDRAFFAVCEEAVNLLAGRDPEQEFRNLVLTSDGVVSTRVSSDRSQMPPLHTSHLFTSVNAWNFIKEFVARNNNNFSVKQI